MIEYECPISLSLLLFALLSLSPDKLRPIDSSCLYCKGMEKEKDRQGNGIYICIDSDSDSDSDSQ